MCFPDFSEHGGVKEIIHKLSVFLVVGAESGCALAAAQEVHWTCGRGFDTKLFQRRYLCNSETSWHYAETVQHSAVLGPSRKVAMALKSSHYTVVLLVQEFALWQRTKLAGSTMVPYDRWMLPRLRGKYDQLLLVRMCVCVCHISSLLLTFVITLGV